jgi:hypothetical protein
MMIKNSADDNLKGYTLKSEHYSLAPKLGNIGSKMFAVLNYQNGFTDEMGLAIGVRNSTDQSMAVGVCMGASVFVCDNLAFSGDIRIHRKHTGDVFGDVTRLVTESLEVAPYRHRSIWEDAQAMKDVPMSNDHAYALLGIAYGREILRPRQFLRARAAWDSPEQVEFEPRTLWSFYNSMTESLKSSSARSILTQHVRSHALCMNQGVSIAEGNLVAPCDELGDE